MSLAQPPTGSKVEQPIHAQKSPRNESQAASRLYRTIWRWHFFAGLFVAPILFVAACTGALYLFKSELELIFYDHLMVVAEDRQRTSYDDQLAAAIAAMPPEFEPSQIVVPNDPTHATTIYGNSGGEFQALYVDQYRGEFLGAQGSSEFFRIVLKIHRTLFVGTFGRIVVELMTCWTIVLLITGTYLWWPRGRAKLWGAWLPRLRRQPYVALRDLHALGGVYVAIVAILIAATGLLYTYVWGSGYRLAAFTTGAYDIFLNPPHSNSAASVPRLPLDEIVVAAGNVMPDKTLSVHLPHDDDGAFVVFASQPTGPSSDEVVVLDHATAEVLMHTHNSEYPALGWWATWNYPLHVGSVLGMWTKIPWLLACLVLMALPVTGIWMWWIRRPKGSAGLPRRYEGVNIPRWILFTILVLSIALPVIGLSLLVILAGDWLWTRKLRKHSKPAVV